MKLITENGPESPALSKAGMNGRSFRAGWVEGKHHSSWARCSPQDEEPHFSQRAGYGILLFDLTY